MIQMVIHNSPSSFYILYQLSLVSRQAYPENCKKISSHMFFQTNKQTRGGDHITFFVGGDR